MAYNILLLHLKKDGNRTNLDFFNEWFRRPLGRRNLFYTKLKCLIQQNHNPLSTAFLSTIQKILSAKPAHFGDEAPNDFRSGNKEISTLNLLI